VTQFSFLSPDESRDLAEHVRDLFDQLATTLAHEERAYSGECHPPLDVRETDRAVEVVVDLCGVAPKAVRVLYHRGVLVVAGEKAAGAGPQGRTFHLVEREFGRFARAVKIAGAIDIPNARATIASGELTIVLPKQAERRGQAHDIPVQVDANRSDGPAS
jgi:HSP20 family protein